MHQRQKTGDISANTVIYVYRHLPCVGDKIEEMNVIRLHRRKVGVVSGGYSQLACIRKVRLKCSWLRLHKKLTHIRNMRLGMSVT